MFVNKMFPPGQLLFQEPKVLEGHLGSIQHGIVGLDGGIVSDSKTAWVLAILVTAFLAQTVVA